MKDLEVVTISDKDYVIVKEIPYKDCIYLYLSGVDNLKDTMIRKVLKSNEEEILALTGEEEFELACALMLKEN